MRLHSIIRRIHESFKPFQTKNGIKFRVRYILARDALSALPGSNVTVFKARQDLGVKAQMIAGRHCWLPPTRTLEQALASAARRSNSLSNLYKVREPKERRWEREAEDLAGGLRLLMQQSGYLAKPSEIKAKIKELPTSRLYSGAVISRARDKAGIEYRRTQLGWRWFMKPPQMQEWLEERLADGSVPKAVLVDEITRAGWAPLVLDLLFTVGAGFKQYMQNGVWYWYDVNAGK